MLSDPIAHILNLSCPNYTSLDQLKISIVITIFKENETNHTGNYRPILNIVNTIMEKLMYKRVMDVQNLHKILYKYQFMF